MFLKQISIINYKNIRQVDLDFSSGINCFIGANGMGKTNLLDAIYYLSFCKSATNPIDSQNIAHDAEFFMIQGLYETADGEDEIYCGLKRHQKKQFKRNKKEYIRLSDHIGTIPLVMISPADELLIQGGSAERRKFMDVVISQYDKSYLHALIRYNKALASRNALLRAETEPDPELLSVCEDIMSQNGELVYKKRRDFIAQFVPTFQQFYQYISGAQEEVALTYESDVAEQSLYPLLQANRQKDRVVGYSLRGIHRDDLLMRLGEYMIKREGSQGQNKTYLIALKLAQFDFLRQMDATRVPILLMDDIFDKLDVDRVKQIVKLVSNEQFGQIFITDTNLSHFDEILTDLDEDHRMFTIRNGQVDPA